MARKVMGFGPRSCIMGTITVLVMWCMEGLKSSLRQLCTLAHSEREIDHEHPADIIIALCFQLQCLTPST